MVTLFCILAIVIAIGIGISLLGGIVALALLSPMIVCILIIVSILKKIFNKKEKEK